MRIFICTIAGKKYSLEAESFDTIGYVKGLVKEKEEICGELRLICGGKEVEDSKTLADYNIQNESTLNMVLKLGEGVRIYIKISPEKTFIIAVGTQDPTINDVKSVIEEKQGIPVQEQRLIFCGEELAVVSRPIKDYGIRDWSILHLVPLRDADNVVDIAAVKARRAALSRDKEDTGNQAEAVSELHEVGSKRVREDSPSANRRHSERNGVNRVEGVESFWDEADFGLAWRRSRSLISPYDTIRFESISHHTLIESVANDCVRTLNVAAFLENQLKEHQNELIRAENELKVLTERNGHLEESLHKEKDTFKKLVQELNVEYSTGTSFLQSEVGQSHIATLERQAAKSAVDEYKKGYAINVLVKDRAMRIYEDIVKECQMLLRKSGRVSEDIIQLISPLDEEKKQQVYEEEEEEQDDDDDEEEDEEMEEDDDDEEMEEDDDDESTC